MRSFYQYEHVGIATRSGGFGAATAPILVGSYASGQLIIRISGLGVGAKLKAFWQTSADGTNFANLATIATLVQTGTYVMYSPSGAGTGRYARMRWSVATSCKFGASFIFQD